MTRNGQKETKDLPLPPHIFALLCEVYVSIVSTHICPDSHSSVNSIYLHCPSTIYTLRSYFPSPPLLIHPHHVFLHIFVLLLMTWPSLFNLISCPCLGISPTLYRFALATVVCVLQRIRGTTVARVNRYSVETIHFVYDS